jgi:hypothetical protein
LVASTVTRLGLPPFEVRALDQRAQVLGGEHVHELRMRAISSGTLSNLAKRVTVS